MSRHGKKLSKRFDLVHIYPLRHVFRLAISLISRAHKFLGEWVKLSRLRSRDGQARERWPLLNWTNDFFESLCVHPGRFRSV